MNAALLNAAFRMPQIILRYLKNENRVYKNYLFFLGNLNKIRNK